MGCGRPAARSGERICLDLVSRQGAACTGRCVCRCWCCLYSGAAAVAFALIPWYPPLGFLISLAWRSICNRLQTIQSAHA
jgi:hypothetical protein